MIGAIDEAKEKAKADKPVVKADPKPKPEVEHAAAGIHES
jgi:hypothetical protein